ncbi:MAG TPA: nucleotidyltransferase family protein [Smithella sp.]|nr:nucleotidyltransferase family protein [Smithella sp.]
MQAIILAGGRGTRLKPYTTVLPKPLMPIGDCPILEVVVKQLKKNGFKKITMAIGHQHDLFVAFFGSGEKWRIPIEYYIEKEPLGTAAPIRHMKNLDDDFLMMNGDILTDLSLKKLFKIHKDKKADLTIATHKRTQNVNYGTLNYSKDGRLTGFREKPSLDFNVSMGIYILSSRVLPLIPAKGRFDFPDLVQKLLLLNRPVHCHAYNGYWMDIGRPEDYEQAIDDYEKMKDVL